MHLLVTRPGTEAERTADILRARGHVVTVAPVLKVETIANAGFGAGPYAAIVMTSANAARVIAGHERRAELLRLPVFTVGRHTAEAVRAAGLDDVISADGGAPELVRLIAAKLQGSGASVLYFAAQERSSDLAGALKPYGIAVETVVVYRTVPSPGLAQDLRAVLDDGLDGVLHYSRRSAQTFLIGAGTAGVLDAAVGLTHYCLSSEVAAPLRAAGADAVKVAPRPDEAALIGLVG
ncbi:MAG: uroporphyrinogen-III synthase [Xanthobacteraceae bacterium]